MPAHADAPVSWRYLFIQYVKDRWRDIVFVVIVVMAGAALAVAISSTGRASKAAKDAEIANRRLNEYTSCKAAYDEKVNERTKALANVSAQERETGKLLKKATSNLFTSPLVDIPEEERSSKQAQEIRTLFRAYQAAIKADDAAIAAADKERAAHPVPEPPSKVCGTPPTAAPKTND
jgi:hypothetical protein